MSTTPSSLPPPVVVLQMLTGKWISQALCVAAQLEVADHLADGPKPVADLARSATADRSSLHRLLRPRGSVGVFAARPARRFENTPLSDAIRKNVPGSMRSMAIFFGDHPTWDPWGDLAFS